MPRRPPQTLADYLVVGICPGLIMFLVGSLMWFLVEVFYQGEFKLRLLFVMAMFVMGVVGIARISMESGFERASIFGAPFAAVIVLAIMAFIRDGLIVGGPLMVLVWWAAHKLTWDCTLIDDTQDASGQGLLQQMGLDPSAPPADRAPPGTTVRLNEPEAATTIDPAPDLPWWERMFQPDRRPHAPGVWVVYFSLAALPLFGLGGWLVPASDPVARARVFGLLVIYVACGMGLLLATSFLGLRKYLRQRRLEMPMEMTSTWIVVGVVMIVAMLLVAAILPRPSREYSLSQLPFTVTSAVRRASRFAMSKEGTKDDAAENPATTEAKDGQTTKQKGGKSGKNDSAEQQSDSSQGQKGGSDGKGNSDGGKSQSSKGGGGKGSKSGKSGTSKDSGDSKSRSAESQSQEKQKADSRAADSSNEQQQQQSQSPDNNAADQQQDGQQPQSEPPGRWSPNRIMTSLTSLVGSTVFFLLKTLFYGVLALGVLIAAWIYREEVAAAWKKLLEELRELWDWFFGKKKTAQEEVAAVETPAPPRPFAAFADPFLTGDAARMTWPQLVRYTFEALEAWGREHDCPRVAGQTAQEFAVAVAAIEPKIAPQLQTLAAWYNQLAYAPRSAAAGSPDPLRQLWHELRARQPRVAAVA